MTARPFNASAKRPAGLCATLLLLACMGEAKAADAVLAALACEPLTKGAAFKLSPADDSPLYLAIDGRIRQAVGRAGHPIQDNAALELYYSAVESIVEVRGRGPNFGRLEVRTVNREARAQLLANVWSNRKDSLIGGRKTKDGVIVSNHLIMSLELNREDNGRCVWRGEGAVDLEGTTAEQVAKGLADAIAANLGKTVDKATTRLP
ncbi:MAG: hypothetical protein GEU87_11055 [Alphaproteobacteria bacterium]|nr:hypothetical protein [Alphaproteobacteria bacterium]